MLFSDCPPTEKLLFTNMSKTSPQAGVATLFLVGSLFFQKILKSCLKENRTS